MNKTINKTGVIKEILTWIILSLIFLIVNCSQNKLSYGSNYPELIYDQGTGTILFFTTEDEKFFLSNQSTVGEVGDREDLANRIRLFLNIIEDEYPDVRVKQIDIAKDKANTTRFQIYDIPTLILVDKYGNEVKRWMPIDFEISGGSVNKLKKEIDKLKKQEERQ